MKRKSLLIFFSLLSLYLAAIEMPKIHTSIVLDGKFYGKGESNTGLYDSSNRFQVRKAALTFSGKIEKYLSYDIEYGISTCVGNGVEFKLMDASIAYELFENTELRIQQGHVLRGFAGSTECSERLTAEKPGFYKTFATCHPTGFVFNTVQQIMPDAEIEIELGALNGIGGTLDGEYDYNAGMIFYTPLQGFDVTANYNFTQHKYINDAYEQFSSEGFRAIFGARYQNYNIDATAEYFVGKGFGGNDPDLHKEAYYAQLGYALNIESERLKYIKPYAKYEHINAHANNPTDTTFKYLEAGLIFSLNSYTKLRISHNQELERPEGIEQKASEFLARLQLNF